VCLTLYQLIPCEAAGWNEVDLEGRSVRAHIHPPLEFSHAALDDLIHTHPLVRNATETGDLGAHTISELLDEDAFHATPIYRRLYRPMGVEDQLGAAIRLESQGLVGVALNRRERSFTEGDRLLLDLLRPHISGAYAHVLHRLDARDRAAALEAELESGRRRFVPDPERLRRYGLTARESEVIALAGRGLSDREIGDQLVLSTRTVHKHLEHVYEKLGVRTRAEAAAKLRPRPGPS
jgi:DNA-binding CsgD family transcriptional regulator